MIVIDNFLGEDSFKYLYSLIDPFASNDKFFFMPYAKVKGDGDIAGNFQFVHNMFTQGSVGILADVGFERAVEPLTIVKAKINFALKSDVVTDSGWHRDVLVPEDVKARTGVLYLNTNNGYTEFEDGTRVESVANRYVEFDSNALHRGVDCNDKPWRAVLNVNYIPSVNSPVYK